MKPAITLFAILAALTLMWAAAAVKITTPADSDQRTSVLLSAESYKRISPGMQVDEAAEIIGQEPTEVMELNDKQGVGATYIWKDSADNTIYIRASKGVIEQVESKGLD